MRLGCLCCTYKRPEMLGRAIYCFQQQTHKNAEMVILDDAGTYRDGDWGASLTKEGSGLNWKIVSVSNRYPDLGSKRAACIDMFSPDVEGVVVWDDDDVMFPNALACQAKALKNNPWCQPEYVYEEFGDSLGVVPAFGIGNRNVRRFWGYGGAWCWRLKEYREIGGYLPTTKESSHLEDIEIANRFFARFGPAGNSTPTPADVFYYYERHGWSISDEGLDFWRKRAEYPMPDKIVCPPIGWNGPDMYEMPVLPEIQARPF